MIRLLCSLSLASLLVVLLPTSSHATHNSLSDCQAVASKFASTCSSNLPASSVSGVQGQTVSCPNWPEAARCVGLLSGTTCSWTRRVCVTCSVERNVVRIRVQTNGRLSDASLYYWAEIMI